MRDKKLKRFHLYPRYIKMAANHEEFLEALKFSTHRASADACQRWIEARHAHPLYHQLSETRTTANDILLLNIIHKDIDHLRDVFLESLSNRSDAWDDYYDFV